MGVNLVTGAPKKNVPRTAQLALGTNSFCFTPGAPWLVQADRGLGLASRSESEGTRSASDFQGELSP